MKLSTFLQFLLISSGIILADARRRLQSRRQTQTRSAYEVPAGSPGFYHGNSTAAVTFDDHSLFVDGKRIFLFGGEFHPFRLPSPTLWSDVLQKMKVMKRFQRYIVDCFHSNVS
jgi:hypothetical protein